jgi:hypothetical protein
LLWLRLALFSNLVALFMGQCFGFFILWKVFAFAFALFWG